MFLFPSFLFSSICTDLHVHYLCAIVHRKNFCLHHQGALPMKIRRNRYTIFLSEQHEGRPYQFKSRLISHCGRHVCIMHCKYEVGTVKHQTRLSKLRVPLVCIDRGVNRTCMYDSRTLWSTMLSLCLEAMIIKFLSRNRLYFPSVGHINHHSMTLEGQG